MPSKDYRFLREEKDPIIDLIRTEAQRYGNLGPEQLEKIAYDSGLSVSTLRAWFFGDTRHPQHLTCKFVLEALGCKMQVVREDGTVVRGPRL